MFITPCYHSQKLQFEVGLIWHQEMNATTMQAGHGGGWSPPLTPLVSPHPASAFLLHRFFLTPVPSSSPLSLGHAKQWKRGKNSIDDKERITISLGSQCSSAELPIFIFWSTYQFLFPPCAPPPSPEASTSHHPPSHCRVRAGPCVDP